MKVNTTRIEVTVMAVALVVLVALAIAPAFWGNAFGQEGRTTTEENASNTSTNKTIDAGQQLSIEGIVIKRDEKEFTVRAKDRSETVVVVTYKTEIKTVRKGLFRRDRATTASEIVRGLRLSVEGKGNSEGKLVARIVRFDEQDLRTAQSLESRVEPVEVLATATQAQANTTQALAEANRQRIVTVEENAQVLSGQVDELSNVAIAARVSATKAQAAAEKAEADANSANDRISALDDYDVLRTVTVQFKSGSAALSAAAKATLDETSESIQNEKLRGWVLAIVGYADSTGNTARNRSLSQRRADAVINYLVTKRDLPMRRLVQPFGYGSSHPVAGNETRAGRAQNRRAEIRIMVNKGIVSRAGSTERTAVVNLTNVF